MANGFHGPLAQWESLETPLRALDVELREYARRHGAALTANSRNWPDRSITWGNTVRRLIQIYLADESRLEYSFWICASEDRGGKRFWRNRFLREAVPIEEIAADLREFLEEGRSLLEGWTSETLEFVTEVAPSP